MQAFTEHIVDIAALPALTTFGAGARAVAGCGQGEPAMLNAAQALQRLQQQPHLLCHAPMLLARLGRIATGQPATSAATPASGARHYDVAELFAFVMPAVAVPPLVSRFGAVLGLMLDDDDPRTLHTLAEALLQRLAAREAPAPDQAAQLARMLARAGWPWARAVLRALGVDDTLRDNAANGAGQGASLATPGAGLFETNALAAWERLPEWEENPPAPPPGQQPVQPQEAVRELRRILGANAEQRPDQHRYAAEVAQAFAPRPSKHENITLLAEAGTGLGKTLGYLAPAALWARRNAGSVWVATYTRNLQRQLLAEAARLWPEEAVRRRRVSVRKGRENHACLLNMEENIGQLAGSGPRGLLLAALLARWLLTTRDGDMVGGDFPAWLMPLLGGERLAAATPAALGLTDRRGECTYAACRHFRKCFIEKARVRAERADVVIANHAVVLTQAAMSVLLGETTPHEKLDRLELARLVFDEGHHLFDAADSAFSGHLSMLEAAEMRRWIRGAEGTRRRGRGLRERLGDLLGGGGTLAGGLEVLQQLEEAARALPAEGWRARLQGGAPAGVAEAFFAHVRQQVLARNARRNRIGNSPADNSPASNPPAYGLEADCEPLIDGLAAAAQALQQTLATVQAHMHHLATILLARLEQESATLTSSERNRLQSMARALIRRGELVLAGWRAMLQRLVHPPADGSAARDLSDRQGEDGQNAAHGRRADSIVMWFSIDYAHGQEHDIGLHAHWVDPTIPLAECVLQPADSVVITSATLRDDVAADDGGWQGAEVRTGATHLPWVARRAGFPSPFDYARQARVFVATDIDRENIDQLAAACRELFIAAGGGAMGVFTAISRLRAVHRRILAPLAQAGLELYAQHVDAMDTGTLIDMFRAREDACLLGTDAVRDGVDVPGRSLRLLVMDRVPWPRPTILERARQQAFGRQRWTDMQVRLRLRQAFGRLIRKADDRGVFVLLDNRLSSRFHPAFPPGASIERLGLADIITRTRDFLQT